MLQHNGFGVILPSIAMVLTVKSVARGEVNHPEMPNPLLMEQIMKRNTTASVRLCHITDVMHIANAPSVRYGMYDPVIHATAMEGTFVPQSQTVWYGKQDASDPNMTI